MIINAKEYKINRNTARVSFWDNEYHRVIKEIIDSGELCENRTGIETLSIPNISFKFENIGKEFPILETKKVAIKNTLSELLWIYQMQSNKVSWLQERNNHVWDEWKIDDDGIYRRYEPYGNKQPDKEVDVYDLEGNVIIGKKACSLRKDKTIKDAKFFGLEYAGTIGTCYGGQLCLTKEFDKNVLNKLKSKETQTDRRKVVNLLQEKYMRTAVLPTCVWSSTYKVYRNKLFLDVSVRSNDMPLGNPFNVTQYAILQSLVAKVSNLEVGGLDWHISDCHLYVNQLEKMKEQLERYNILIKWEKFVAKNNDKEIASIYNDLLLQKQIIDKKSELEDYKEPYRAIKEETDLNILALEHIITREEPQLKIANKKSFYDFDNSENNKDIKILKYSSLPGLKIPLAQ